MNTYTVVFEKRLEADSPWFVDRLETVETGHTLMIFKNQLQVKHSEWLDTLNHRVLIHEWD